MQPVFKRLLFIPCGFAYLSALDAIKIGSDDTIYLLWNSSVKVTNFAPERIYFAKSTDDGQSYSKRVDVSDAPPGVEHCFLELTVGKVAEDVRIGWMDKQTKATLISLRLDIICHIEIIFRYPWIKIIKLRQPGEKNQVMQQVTAINGLHIVLMIDIQTK